MKKISVLAVVFVVSLALIGGDVAFAARNRTLSFVKHKKVTKVYIADIINTAGDSNIDLARLKKAIQNAFLKNFDHKFELAADEADTDMVVAIDIQEYKWMEEDPVEHKNAFMASLDAATKEHYAAMKALVTVSRPGKKRKLFDGEVTASVTTTMMEESDSYKLVDKQMAKVLTEKLLTR